MINKSRYWFLGVLSSVALLAACSSGTSQGASSQPALGSGSSGSSSSSNPSGSDNSSGAVSTPAPQGGTLTVGSAVTISQLNPVIASLAWEHVLFPLLWNGLVKLDSDGTIGPDLATSWDRSDDLKTWTFHLRDGVTFSDGTPLTAQNVANVLNYYLDEKTGSSQRVTIQMVSDVTAPDDKTVVFTLSIPLADFLPHLVDVRIIDFDKLSEINTAPNGTGPYMLKEFVPDDHVTLVRNSTYFGDPARLDQINIVAAQDSTAALSALRSGDLDLVDGLSYADAGSFADDPAFQVIMGDTYEWNQTWWLDNSTAPFNNPKARQALAYAVDRETIVKKAYFGLAQAAPANTLIPPSSPYLAKSGLIDYSYNLDKAKQLFAEAGVKKGDHLTWWGPAGIQPEKVATAQILAGSLKQIGITLDIKSTPVSEWTPAFIPAGQEFPGYIVPTGSATLPDPASLLARPLSGACFCNWNNAEFDSAYNQTLSVADEAQRNKSWDSVQAMISQQVPLVVPYVTSFPYGAKASVTGVWSSLGGTSLHLEDAGISAG